MDRRGYFSVLALLFCAVAVAGCDGTYSGYSAPAPQGGVVRTPSAWELARQAEIIGAQETAVAKQTTESLEAVARSTAEALEIEKRATQQAVDLESTRIAQGINSTRAVWEMVQTQEAAYLIATERTEARQATATRQALDATSTAVCAQSTATAQAWESNVQATQAAVESFAIEATRQAIERQAERERVTQPLRAWGIWIVLAFMIPCLAWFGWRMAKTFEDRARVVRRGADEGEPFVLLEQGRDGNRRIALPLRSFNALMDTDKTPTLPEPEMQDRATMRQQTTNAIQARQVAATVKARKAHRAKAPRIVAGSAKPLPQARQTGPRERRQVPGLVRVVSASSLEEATKQGILSPRLAGTIEGQWHEVDEED